MKKTRICLFSELWESGGVESFLSGILHSVDLDSMEVDIVAARIGNSVFREPLTRLGVNFFELSGKLRSPKNHAIFARILKERNYDVIHFNLFQSMAFYYIHQAKRAGVSVRIAHAHGAGLRKTYTRPLKLLLHCIGRALWQRDITLKLACSGKAADFLFGTPADEIIKNGINAEKFEYSANDRQKIRNELGIGKSPLVGHVGRMSVEKNQEFLLSTHRELLNIMPEARLLLVGDGPTEDKLRGEAARLGISDSVIFLGASKNIPQIMSSIDVFAFPSFSEGLGIVAIEAQCSGLPVLCSEGIPTDAFITELISAKNLSDGSSEWASALSEILSKTKTSERYSRTKDIINSGFDSRSAANQIIKHYNIYKNREVTYA